MSAMGGSAFKPSMVNRRHVPIIFVQRRCLSLGQIAFFHFLVNARVLMGKSVIDLVTSWMSLFPMGRGHGGADRAGKNVCLRQPLTASHMIDLPSARQRAEFWRPTHDRGPWLALKHGAAIPVD